MLFLSRQGEAKVAHFDPLRAGTLFVILSLWVGCAAGEEPPVVQGNSPASMNRELPLASSLVPSSPVILQPHHGQFLNTQSPTFSGTAGPGHTVKVYVNDSPLGSTLANLAGLWSLSSPVALIDGTYAAKASATDGAGDTSEPSATISFTVDTIAPQPPSVTAPADGSRLRNSSPIFSGVAEIGNTVRVFVNGIELGSTAVASSGNWSLPSPGALIDGSYEVVTRSIDEAGNTSEPSATITFTVDTVVPNPPTIEVPACVRTSPVCRGFAEPGSVIRLYLDATSGASTAVADSQGQWSLTLPSVLSDGSHVVRATATDAASNESNASPSVAFVLDTVSPSPPAVTSHADGAVVRTARILFQGTAEPHSTIFASVDGDDVCATETTASGTWECTVTRVLPEGLHQFSAAAEDCAGNRSPASSLAFTVNRVVSQISSPQEGGYIRAPLLVVTGTAEPGSSIEVVVDQAHVIAAQADSAGAWSVTLSAPLSEGTHSLSVTVIDTAGNPVTTTLSFTVDTTPPETLFSGEAPQLQSSPPRATFEFSSEAGATFECSRDGASFSPCQSPLTFEGLQDGEHTFSVRAKDRAGNVDSSPATASWSQSTPVEEEEEEEEEEKEEEEGGCSAARGTVPSLLAWLTLALFAARWRGRGHRASARRW